MFEALDEGYTSPMELILTVVRYQDRPSQPALTARIGIAGGTIGRNSDNELVLTDPERWVGRRHAGISFRDGAFFLTDTSKNGTFINNAAEPLHEGQEVELHDGDELNIGAYEIRVSHEVSQPQPAAPFDPFADGKPELEPLAPTPSGHAAPDIMDLVAGTPAGTDPLSPPAAQQKTSAGPADWLTSAPPEQGPQVLEPEPPATPATATEPDHTPDWNASYSPPEAIPEDPEPEPPVAPAAATEPDHTPHRNASCGPPEAIPEDYDILADTSHPQPTEQDLSIAGSESPPAPTAPEPAPIEEQQEQDLPLAGPESPPGPTTSDPAPVEEQKARDLTIIGPESSPAPSTSGAAPSEEQPAPSPPATERTRGIRPAPAPAVAGEINALQALLAGLDAGELPADRQAQVELMRTTGLLLRAMTEGLMRVLMGRTSFKNELRVEVTRIQARENNPFKFSVDPADALAHLLFRPSRGFLPPLEAAREAFDDIQCHEMALVAGLRAALHALLKRMDPAELENRFRGRSVIDNLMPMARKAKYWDLFTETYQEIAADAADDFLNLFRDAFTRAYEEQAARLKQARPRDRTSP